MKASSRQTKGHVTSFVNRTSTNLPREARANQAALSESYSLPGLLYVTYPVISSDRTRVRPAGLARPWKFGRVAKVGDLTIVSRLSCFVGVEAFRLAPKSVLSGCVFEMCLYSIKFLSDIIKIYDTLVC